MTDSGNYQLLLAKLEEFRRKYYLNQLIRGALFSLAALMAAYLVISVLEYRFYFPVGVRRLLFFGGMASALGLLGYWVGGPLLRYFRLGRTLNDQEAARLIGSHFQEVEDRLLNVLQLRQQADAASDSSLILASINQKIEAIKPIPFTLAIDLSRNRRYLKYALPPVLALVFLVFAAPNVLRESNTRLLHNGQVFEREAPFSFTVVNESLEGIQFQDFLLQVEVAGQVLPEQIALVVRGAEEGPFRMQKFSATEYGYTFHKLAGDVVFAFEAAGFRSREYTLKALPSPGLQRFELHLDYPSYTGRQDEVVQGRGDASVPVGTTVTWILQTENTEEVGLRFSDSLYQAERRGKGEFRFSKRIVQDEGYKIGLGNGVLSTRDSIAFRIAAVQDQFPSIQVERFIDSTNNKYLYFLGESSDDYGLRNLNFHWSWEASDALGERQVVETGQVPIGLSAGQKRSAFSHHFDVSRLGLKPGDRVSYYFEVWDNDGVNGTKSSRTAAMTYEMATLEAFEQKTEANNNQIKDKLEKTLSDIDDTREEVDRLREKLMQKKELDWEDQKNLENLLDKQQQIQQNVQDIQKSFQENVQDQSDYKQYDEQLMRKQEQLQKMFEEVVSDELKELFEEMEKLLEELSKEEGLEKLEEMSLTDEQLENELDRMLELFKKLEMEQKMEDVISKLEDLAEKQEQLANEAGKESSDPKDLAEQQEKLNEQFDKVREEMDKLEQLNDELSQPEALPETGQQEEQIEQGMEQSKEQMEQSAGSQSQGKPKQSQQQKQQSGEQMKQNAQQMEEMAEQLNSALSGMQQEQTSENLDALKQLLDNLITLSFDQEELMKELDKVQPSNPRYVELVQEQFNIREDSRMVEDSLIALSKRVFEISSFITRELADLNHYMEDAMGKLQDRRLKEAGVDQQFVMTSMNNLALMLSEVMDQMQQQMASQMSGNQMCQKPGGGKPSNAQMKEMGDLQQQLNSQLQQLKEGQKPGQRNPLGAQQFAQMAAKQAAIRRALQELGEQMNGTQEQGDLAKELKEIADQMEKTEEDLVNKVFDSEMLMRQQEIMTRMLEAEEALRQRELDPKRKGVTASDVSRELPPSLQEYLKKRQAEIDLFKTVPADLKPYYRDLVEEYLNGLEF